MTYATSSIVKMIIGECSCCHSHCRCFFHLIANDSRSEQTAITVLEGSHVKICLMRSTIWNIDLFPFRNTGRRNDGETSLEISPFFLACNAWDTACSNEHLKTAFSLCSAVPCSSPPPNKPSLFKCRGQLHRLKIKSFTSNTVDHTLNTLAIAQYVTYVL